MCTYIPFILNTSMLCALKDVRCNVIQTKDVRFQSQPICFQKLSKWMGRTIWLSIREFSPVWREGLTEKRTGVKFQAAFTRKGRKVALSKGIWELFVYTIRNPGFWNPEYSSRNPESSTDKYWNPVPGIRNRQRGIQNPRLSWIPLHGAMIGPLFIHAIVVTLLRSLKWRLTYRIGVHTIVGPRKANRDRVNIALA